MDQIVRLKVGHTGSLQAALHSQLIVIVMMIR